MPVVRESRHYNMNHKRRGMAIIFNHEYFDDPSLRRRKGTKVDGDNLKDTMQLLGFDVKIYDDMDRKDLMKNVDEG
jgi:caspase-like apoptosis-related cysteine protease